MEASTTRISRRSADNHHHSSSTQQQQQQQQQQEVLSRLGECLKKATDLGENYNGKGELIFQALCGEVSYSEEDKGWRVLHNNGSQDQPVSCIALVRPLAEESSAKSHPPVELLQSIFTAQELCFMLDRANSKDDKRHRSERCLCKARTGHVFDVTDLLSESQEAKSLLTKVSRTAELQELWEVEEYQGWSIQKQCSEGQPLSKKNRSLSSLASNEETAPTAPSSSSISVVSSSTDTCSNWSIVHQLLAGVKGCVTSLQQGSEKETENNDESQSSRPKAKRRKLGHVSFARSNDPETQKENGEHGAAADEQRRRLRSADHNNNNNNNNQEESNQNVRVVSPPALELSSESDITTDDEHHKDEEDKHASDDEEYKESDSSGHDEDDELFESETVGKSAAQAQQQQHYPTRRAASAKHPTSQSTSSNPTEHSLRVSTRKRGRAGETEESTGPKDWKLVDGPPLLHVHIKGKGLGVLKILEAQIGKEGIPERRQTRRSHGIHIEAPRRFIEVDSNEGWPSSFSHHREQDHNNAVSSEPAPTRKEAKKDRSSTLRAHGRQASAKLSVEKEGSSPVRRSHRTRTCRSDSYEEPNEDEIDEMEEAAIQAEEEQEDEGEPRVPFVLDSTNQLSAARLVSGYEEHCVKQHGLCVSLKGLHGDEASAKDAVLNLLEECEDLNSKYNRSEEDEDIVAERQLAGRSLRVIQGRMNQEIIARMQEKEQAELLAIAMAYQRKNKKKHAMTMNEMEWEEIQDRPIHFAAKNVRCNSRSIGSTSCPCAPKPTHSRRAAVKSDTAEEVALCLLCLNPDGDGDRKPEAVQNKNMVPLFRMIDVDAPDFADRDLDDEELEKKASSERVSKPTRKTRCSNRLRNDSRARQETTQKLYEMKHSIAFMEQYNSGLITEKLKECRK